MSGGVGRFDMHLCCMCAQSGLTVTPWTIACQAPLSMEFSRQEHWSGLPFPSPGDLPDPGVEPTSLVSPALAGRFLITSSTWESHTSVILCGCSVTQSCPTLRHHGLQHARHPCPSPSPGACSNSSPLSRWCHPTISSSVIPFSSCLQSFLPWGSFLVN